MNPIQNISVGQLHPKGNFLQPDTFDSVFISGISTETEFILTDMVTGYYQDTLMPITTSVPVPHFLGATGLGLFAVFEANTFSIGSLQNQFIQSLLDFNSARFLAFMCSRANLFRLP